MKKNGNEIPISDLIEPPSPRESFDRWGVPISTVVTGYSDRPPLPRPLAPISPGWSTLALIGAGILGYWLGQRGRRRSYGPLY